LLAKSSFSSFTVRLLVSVFLFSSPFLSSSSATVVAGSTEALLERREERLDGGGGGGAGEGDLDRVVRFLFGGEDGFSSSSAFVEIGGARGGGKGTSISFSSGIVSGMFFGFSFSSLDGFFAGSLIVHGAKSFACIPGDTERCLVNPLLPISGIFGPSALFLFGAAGLVHVFAFCLEGGTYGAAFIVISPGGGTNFFGASPSSFTSPSSSSSSLPLLLSPSSSVRNFFGGGGTNTFSSTFSLALILSLVHSFGRRSIISSLSIGPSYSLALSSSSPRRPLRASLGGGL